MLKRFLAILENFRVLQFLNFWLNLSPPFLIGEFLIGETGVYSTGKRSRPITRNPNHGCALLASQKPHQYDVNLFADGDDKSSFFLLASY